MKTQIFLSTVAALFVAIGAFAQTSITSKNNGYRDGDKLYRIIVDCKSAGGRGENCVWELPPVKKDDNYVRQSIILKDDSLTIVEGDLMLHYIATDKGIFMRGFQNRDFYSVQDRLLPELKFPFTYGDSIADTYSRKTTYFNTFTIEGEGSCYTVCDGWGVLTDGNETLKDVLRIHHHNTIKSKYDSFDNEKVGPIVSEVTEDKYLWYYSGCRYPVMDTRIIRSKSNGKSVSDTIFTSLYMPDLQLSELAYDDANSQIIAQRKDSGHSPDKSGDGKEDATPFPITMSASLQPSQSEILLEFIVAENVDATFYAYDLAGRMLGCITHVSLGKGEYYKTMSLDRRPINSVVMLEMIAGDKRQVVKVS